MHQRASFLENSSQRREFARVAAFLLALAEAGDATWAHRTWLRRTFETLLGKYPADAQA